MNALVWAVRLVLVLVLVWFAVRNSQPVTLNGLPGQAWEAPLVLALLTAFVAGVAVGVLAWLPTVFRQRYELGRLRRSAAPTEAERDRKGAAHGI